MINQSKLFLKWPKWHSHCKDHWLGEVSKLNHDRIAEIKRFNDDTDNVREQIHIFHKDDNTT